MDPVAAGQVNGEYPFGIAGAGRQVDTFPGFEIERVGYRQLVREFQR